MTCAHVEVRNRYLFPVPKDPLHSLGDMITASIYVWDSKKLVPEDGDTGTLSRKRHFGVDAIGPGLTKSATTVSSNAHPFD